MNTKETEKASISTLIQSSQDGFIRTLNGMGFMTAGLDPFSNKFVEFSARQTFPVCEIGAAFGIASLKALELGASVVANDLDERHLEVLKNSAGTNVKRLQLLPGKFPEGVSVPEHSLSGILICRVLHFFSGDSIEESFKWCYQALKPSGKLFIVADTPYLRCFSSFVPIFEQRKHNGTNWPGAITNLKDYAGDRGANLPEFFHALDPETLSKVLKKCGFRIEESNLFSRTDYPEDIRFQGNEGVGVVAVKD